MDKNSMNKNVKGKCCSSGTEMVGEKEKKNAQLGAAGHSWRGPNLIGSCFMQDVLVD
jgi:hypothetical protein